MCHAAGQFILHIMDVQSVDGTWPRCSFSFIISGRGLHNKTQLREQLDVNLSQTTAHNLVYAPQDHVLANALEEGNGAMRR